MVSVAKQTLVTAETGMVFFAHHGGGFHRRLFGVVHHLRLFGMLVDMRLYAERAPGVSGYEEVPEPDLASKLVRNPYLEVFPFYSRFLFHIEYK